MDVRHDLNLHGPMPNMLVLLGLAFLISLALLTLYILFITKCCTPNQSPSPSSSILNHHVWHFFINFSLPPTPPTLPLPTQQQHEQLMLPHGQHHHTHGPIKPIQQPPSSLHSLMPIFLFDKHTNDIVFTKRPAHHGPPHPPLPHGSRHDHTHNDMDQGISDGLVVDPCAIHIDLDLVDDGTHVRGSRDGHDHVIPQVCAPPIMSSSTGVSSLSPLGHHHDHSIQECSICLSPFLHLDELCIFPSCLHPFHASCVYAWLRLNRSCPLCRSDIVVGSKDRSHATTPSSHGHAAIDVDHPHANTPSSHGHATIEYEHPHANTPSSHGHATIDVGH